MKFPIYIQHDAMQGLATITIADRSILQYIIWK